jgi:DNA repair exonuclease SbcCD nuclease subunit
LKQNKKVLILTDLHLGARGASVPVAEYQIAFFEEQIFPELKKRKIHEIVCLGDMFDVRQHTSNKILEMWKSRVFDVMHRDKIKFHIIVGNHDAQSKNTISVNSPKLLLSHYSNVVVHDVPREVDVGVNRFLFSPWICIDNFSETMKLVKESKCSTVMGHFEFSGFEMFKGQMAEEGLDPKLFDKFRYVFSGHYHHKSDDGRIHYLGSPYEFTWADYDDPRGFHIFDTESLDLEFVKNTKTMFLKYHYDDTDMPDDYWKRFDCSSIDGKYLKLIVVNKTKPLMFDKLVLALNDSGLSDFKIIEDMSEFNADMIDDDDLQLEDSATLIDSYIDALDVSVDKTKLKSLAKSMYITALNSLE